LLLLFKKPEFTDKKVMAGKEYEYRVTAENAGGESDPSDVSNLIKAKPLKGLTDFICTSRQYRNKVRLKIEKVNTIQYNTIQNL